LWRVWEDDGNKFEMFMIGELSYFLGLQIKQLKNSIFVSQGKYIKYMLKKFGMNDSKVISTPMGAYSIWPHQDRMSCLVCVCVQDFKPHQEKVIWKQQREY
jgi:hypothetical protein